MYNRITGPRIGPGLPIAETYAANLLLGGDWKKDQHGRWFVKDKDKGPVRANCLQETEI